MQCANLSTSDFSNEEKSRGTPSKLSSGSRPSFRLEPDGSVLRRLLAASKDAEVLIACLFELNSIEAAPLQKIWGNLSVAIRAAQQSLTGAARK